MQPLEKWGGIGEHKTITFPDISSSNGTTSLDFYRVGNVISVTGQIFKSASGGQWVTSSTKIPERFRPIASYLRFSFSTSSDTNGVGYINNNGDFSIFSTNVQFDWAAVNMAYTPNDATYVDV